MKKLALSFLAATLLFGQAGKLKFDAVSIKPNNASDTNWRVRGLGDAGGRFSVSNVDLRFLIGAAYGDPSPMSLGNNATEITGLPGWAGSAKYDVEAQPVSGFNPTAQQGQEMLRTLLEERFKLKLRIERKSRSIYNLVVDNGGLKMKPYAPPAPGAARPQPPGPAPKGGRQFRLLKADMAAVVSFLTSQAGRKVVDKTGLTGFYEVGLTYTPDLPQGAENDPNVPSLFTALREQLGLRLVSETGPVDTYVVESVQKPSAN